MRKSTLIKKLKEFDDNSRIQLCILKGTNNYVYLTLDKVRSYFIMDSERKATETVIILQTNEDINDFPGEKWEENKDAA